MHSPPPPPPPCLFPLTPAPLGMPNGLLPAVNSERPPLVQQHCIIKDVAYPSRAPVHVLVPTFQAWCHRLEQQPSDRKECQEPGWSAQRGRRPLAPTNLLGEAHNLQPVALPDWSVGANVHQLVNLLHRLDCGNLDNTGTVFRGASFTRIKALCVCVCV